METKDKKPIMICSECGSDNIHLQMWVNPNTKQIFDDAELDLGECWCEVCESHFDYKVIYDVKQIISSTVMEKTSVEILPLSERGLYEVCQSADDAVSYALKLEEALEAAEKEISKLKLELGEGLTKNFF